MLIKPFYYKRNAYSNLLGDSNIIRCVCASKTKYLYVFVAKKKCYEYTISL